MKKKGFTLIELLAVIVILAIIALIATPLVLKYIKNFNCSCENKDLINAILKLKSLEISAKTGRFEQVAYYWFKYFK